MHQTCVNLTAHPLIKSSVEEDPTYTDEQIKHIEAKIILSISCFQEVLLQLDDQRAKYAGIGPPKKGMFIQVIKEIDNSMYHLGIELRRFYSFGPPPSTL